jgi:hypothetical protein
MRLIKNSRAIVPGIGNNGFSFEKKPDRPDLYVPAWKCGTVDDVTLGDKVVFQDFDGDQWVECAGLDAEILIEDFPIPLYLMDNHHHAFWAWCHALKKGSFENGASLVHVDAHYDDREPPDFQVDIHDIDDVSRYTDEVLQIATFIQPALHHGIFSDVKYYVESAEFDEELPPTISKQVVMDVDLDVFCDEMSHVSWSTKIEVLKHYLPQTKAMTFATSPFFIDQKKALQAFHRVLEELF